MMLNEKFLHRLSNLFDSWSDSGPNKLDKYLHGSLGGGWVSNCGGTFPGEQLKRRRQSINQSVSQSGSQAVKQVGPCHREVIIKI